MRVVFMGTPQIAADCLSRLIADGFLVWRRLLIFGGIVLICKIKSVKARGVFSVGCRQLFQLKEAGAHSVPGNCLIDILLERQV
mgnify:CR=1 FL=1